MILIILGMPVELIAGGQIVAIEMTDDAVRLGQFDLAIPDDD